MKIAEWYSAGSPHADRRLGSWRIGWRWKLAFAVWALAFWGARPIWEPDPARYAEVAREALVGGNWLVPHINGAVHLTKPPFTYWITALGMKLFGVNAWGAQFFLSLAFMGTIFCTIELARTWGWERRRALTAGLVFATALLTFACANVLSTDMFLTFFETLGMLAAWKIWRADAKVERWRLVFWMSFALAFFTKGPPAWLPLLVICVFHYACPRRQALRGLSLGWGVPVMLAVSTAWYIAVAIARPGTLDYWLGYEVRDRIFTEVQGRTHFFMFYFVVLPLGCGPWLALWPELIKRTWKKLRQGWGFLRDEQAFSLLWVAVPFAILNFVGSKMFLYLTPLMVPMSLWLGRVGADAMQRMPSMSPALRRSVFLTAFVWLSGLMLFRMLPASLSGDRTHVGLAQQAVREKLLDGIELFTPQDHVPPYSFIFYSGILIDEPTTWFHRIPDFLYARELAGRPCAVIVERNELKSLIKNEIPGVAYDVLAADNEYAIVRFNPAHIPQLFPPPAPNPTPAPPESLDMNAVPKDQQP